MVERNAGYGTAEHLAGIAAHELSITTGAPSDLFAMRFMSMAAHHDMIYARNFTLYLVFVL